MKKVVFTLFIVLAFGFMLSAQVENCFGGLVMSCMVEYQDGEEVAVVPGFHNQEETTHTATTDSDKARSYVRSGTPLVRTIYTRSSAGVAPASPHKLIPSGQVQLTAFPNPTNQSTTIEYYLPTEGEVTLQLTDFLGRPIQFLEKRKFKSSGVHQLQLAADKFSVGNYNIMLRVGNDLLTEQLSIVR